MKCLFFSHKLIKYRISENDNTVFKSLLGFYKKYKERDYDHINPFHYMFIFNISIVWSNEVLQVLIAVLHSLTSLLLYRKQNIFIHLWTFTSLLHHWRFIEEDGCSSQSSTHCQDWLAEIFVVSDANDDLFHPGISYFFIYCIIFLCISKIEVFIINKYKSKTKVMCSKATFKSVFFK